MIEALFTFLTALAFGVGVGLLAFGIIYCYRAFVGESVFENPFIIQAVSFVFIVIGLTLLFLIFLKFA
jgi:hypothetical protein